MRRHDGQRGNALIEFVIVLPLFLTLLLGMIDWGWYFVVRETAVNAVRQGARTGSVTPHAAAATAAAQTAVSTYLKNSLGTAYAKTPTVGTSACGTETCLSVALTSYPVVPTGTSITGLSAWTRVPATLTVQAEMRLEQP